MPITNQVEVCPARFIRLTFPEHARKNKYGIRITRLEVGSWKLEATGEKRSPRSLPRTCAK
jgi:hypothetical protein